MTVRQLQRQLDHAVKMRRLYRLRCWDKAIAKLNLEIMARVRPAKPANTSGRRAVVWEAV